MRKSKKFRSSLVKQIREDEKERLHQEELKQKYDIKDNTVVVEKSNTIKFVTKTIIGLVRFLAALIVFLLAITGLAAILYPDSRNILIHQALQVYRELLELL